jgi:hypothetical protein
VFLRRIAFCIALVAICSAADDIRAVDFKNLTYRWPSDEGGVPSTWNWLVQGQNSAVRLVDGVHSFSESSQPESGEPYVMLSSVTYGDLTGDGRDEAAVDLVYGTGGTANWHYLYVYTIANRAPKLLGVLRSGSRADGGLVRIAIEKRLLVLDFQDTDRRTADCCSEGWIRVAYRWQGTHFAETGSRSHGDLK